MMNTTDSRMKVSQQIELLESEDEDEEVGKKT